MSAYFVIMAIGAVVILAVWRWDERARRAELDRRRRLRLMQTSRADERAADAA
jgi:hypothetical protein